MSGPQGGDAPKISDSEWLAAEDERIRRAKAKKRWLLSLGCLACFLSCCCAILWPVFPAARLQPKKAAALSNVKQLDLAALMYSNDADDRYPSAGIWMDLILPYVKDKGIFHAPGLPDPDVFGVAFRRSLSRVKTDDVEQPATTVVVFDSTDTRWNANGELNLLPQPGRYGDHNVVSFVDGTVKVIPAGPLGPAVK